MHFCDVSISATLQFCDVSNVHFAGTNATGQQCILLMSFCKLADVVRDMVNCVSGVQ